MCLSHGINKFSRIHRKVQSSCFWLTKQTFPTRKLHTKWERNMPPRRDLASWRSVPSKTSILKLPSRRWSKASIKCSTKISSYRWAVRRSFKQEHHQSHYMKCDQFQVASKNQLKKKKTNVVNHRDVINSRYLIIIILYYS